MAEYVQMLARHPVWAGVTAAAVVGLVGFRVFGSRRRQGGCAVSDVFDVASLYALA